MNKNILRILALLPGIPMFLNGIGFLTQPSKAAASLGMELLDGIGRSTQVGDMASFFLGIAGLIFFGAYRCEGRWLYVAGMFIAAAAVFRSVAALALGADWATQFIVIELILAAWLGLCAFYINRPKHEAM